MNYTDEQFQTLAPFEGYFRTATRSGYAGYVGFRNAEKIDKIIREAGLYKSGARTNYACAACVLRILRIAGKAWFEDQEARIAAANDAEAAKISAQQALDESAAKPSLDVEVDGDIVEATATYLAPEPTPAQEPATAPSTPKAAPTSTKTPKAAKTAQSAAKPAKQASPKSKTAKK